METRKTTLAAKQNPVSEQWLIRHFDDSGLLIPREPASAARQRLGVRYVPVALSSRVSSRQAIECPWFIDGSVFETEAGRAATRVESGAGTLRTPKQLAALPAGNIPTLSGLSRHHPGARRSSERKQREHVGALPKS